MSASQFPVSRASAVTPEQPTVDGAELQHIAQELQWIEKLVDLAADQRTSALDQRLVLQFAQEHVAGLVAYTQPWVEIGGRPADSGPSLWRP